MAQLVLGAAGAVAGFFVGGPTGAQIGFALGSAVGASMTTQKVQGPRLSDLKTPQSAYGSVLPYIEGVVRTAGVWAWNSEKRETATRRRSGGKGGPRVETTTYSYDMDVLILLSENELGGIRRIWANGKLVWSLADSASDDTVDASLETDLWERLTFYSGAATQLPDPTYEAAVGVGNAPAYRGRGSVFIEGLNLGGSGQIPALTFEVFSSGTAGAGQTLVERFNTADNLAAIGYTATAGDFGLFSIQTVPSEGNGLAMMGVANPVADTISKNVAPTLAASIDFDFRIISVNSDDGCVFGLFNGTTPFFQFNPVRESTFDTYRRGRMIVGGNTVIFGPETVSAALPVSVWMRMSIDLAAGAGASSYSIVRKDNDTVVYSGTFTAAPQEIDRIQFSADNVSSPNALSGTLYADIRVSSVRRATVNSVSLADAVARQCERGGLLASQYDVSALSGTIRGFAVSQVGPPRAVIEMLGLAYQFDAFESGGKIKFRPRAQPSVATIAYGDLGASDGEVVEPLPLTRVNDRELPSQIVVKYANVLNDYQDGAEASERLTAGAASIETTELAMVLTPTEARRIAEIRANDIQNSVIAVQGLSLDRSFMRLEPCDPITVTDDSGTSFRLRILRISDSGIVRKIDAALDSQSAMTGAATTDESYVSSESVLGRSGAQLALMDIPLLRDVDDGIIHYLATSRASNSGAWNGAEVFRGVNDSNYTSLISVSGQTYIGRTIGALGAFSGGTVFDELNSIVVEGVGELESWTRDDILNGVARPLLVGAEIVYYQSASPGSSPGSYTLRRLLRGRRGTEWAIGSHASNERVVLLSESGVAKVTNSSAELNVPFDFKAAPPGAALDTLQKTTFSNTGVALRPFSPVDIRRIVSASGVEIQWKRRTRLSAKFVGPSGPVVPLGEPSERYRVKIYSSGSPRTLLSETEVTEPRLVAGSITSGVIVKEYSEGVVAPKVSGGSLYGVQAEGSGVRRMVRLDSSGAVAAQSFALSDRDVLYDVLYVGSTAYVSGHFLTNTVPQTFFSSRLMKFDLGTLDVLDAWYSPASPGDLNCLAWDGSNVWSTGYITGVLRKHAADMSVIDTFSVGSGAWGLQYASGVFYIGSIDGTKVIAYNPSASPAQLWSRDLGDYHQRIFLNADLIYVSGASGKVYVLDASDGSIVRTFTDGQALSISPAAAEFSVYDGGVWYRPSTVNAALGAFRKLSPADGSKIADIPLNGVSVVYGTINSNLYGVGSPTNSFNDYRGYELAISNVDVSLSGVVVSVQQIGRDGVAGYPAELAV